MSKDSQLDKKSVRLKKSNGENTFAQSENQCGSCNSKKQSGNRHKPGNDPGRG